MRGHDFFEILFCLRENGNLERDELKV